MKKFLESSLRHRSEMVMYEAARAICNLPGVEMNDLSPAINVLQVRALRWLLLMPGISQSTLY